MSKIKKLIDRLVAIPSDFTWEELTKVLHSKGYYEQAKKGKTGGSRRKFINDKKDIINLHKPHPRNIVKKYVLEQVIEKLNL